MNDLVPYQAAPPPPLVDSRGVPLRSAADVLTREISAASVTGIRNINAGHPAQGLTPQRLAQILRAAEMGDATAYLELAEEMEEKDLHYQSIMGTRKRAVAQLPIEVEAASDSSEDEADAQLIRDWLKRLTLQAELFDILDAIGKGFSATEIIWELGEQWLPRQLKMRDPRFFEFDRVTGEQLLLRGDGGVPTPLHSYKYIVHLAPAKSGLPIRGGLARAAAWGYLFKNYSIKDWVAFLEVYGLPLRVGKYAPGTSEADIRLLERAIAQIGSDAGAVVPQSMLIEFITAGGAAANPDMFQKLCTYFDDQLSKAVLGQTSSADAKAGGLGSGQANLHGEVRHDIETADAVQLSATLTRDLGVPIVMFNRGARRRYPLILVGRPDPVDVQGALKSIDAALKAGVPVAVSLFRKLTGLAAPEPGDELLQPPADPARQATQNPGDGSSPAETPPPAFLDPLKRRGGANRPARETAIAAVAISATDTFDNGDGDSADAVDRAIDDAMEDWEAMLGPVVAPLSALVEGSADLGEVRAGLVNLIGQMDDTALVEMLARARFAARLQGDALIQDEMRS